MKYRIVETCCFPNAWKIEAIGYKNDNATCNFFPSSDDAVKEIERRGGVVQK